MVAILRTVAVKVRHSLVIVRKFRLAVVSAMPPASGVVCAVPIVVIE